MIANLMLAAALTGVHTPETSKLFERRTDPESGVVSYSLVYGAPDDNRQSLYFVTKSMTEDGRFLVFNYTKGNERKGRGPRKLMVADLLKDEVHELGDPGMIPFVDCKKDYIVYGRIKQNPGFYRQNLDDPGREIKLCDIPGALTEMGRVRYLATHLTLTRDRSKAFLDASVIAPNGATNYVQGLLTLANGVFESWGTTDFFCNHGQLSRAASAHSCLRATGTARRTRCGTTTARVSAGADAPATTSTTTTSRPVARNGGAASRARATTTFLRTTAMSCATRRPRDGGAAASGAWRSGTARRKGASGSTPRVRRSCRARSRAASIPTRIRTSS